MKKLFRFLGFKESEKEEIQKEGRRCLIELEKKYNLDLNLFYEKNCLKKILILKYSSEKFYYRDIASLNKVTYGIYEKLCIDGDCVEKFTFIPNPNKPNKEDGLEEYRVDSLEIAVKYVSDYLKNKAELEKEKEEELKLKEIEKIKTLPELKM
jgi:hypothetical protein